jgi:hypothetical protein
MIRHRPAGVASLAGIVVAAVAIAGCGGSSHAGARAQRVPRPVAVPLAAAVAEPGISWATVQTGAPSAGGRFWQLLTEDQATGKWRLATPPGVADNAGLAVTRAPDGTMTAGFVPGDLLRFSPLATSSDNGGHWTQGLLPAGLAPDPDSLAALPDGRLVAVTTTAVEESTAGGKSWTPLVTLRALAATPDGRGCGLTGLTGTAAAPDGSVLISGICRRAGRLGLFSNEGGRWQIAIPALADLRDTGRANVSDVGLANLRGVGMVTVLGLVSSAAGVSVLVDAARAHGQALLPAWLAAGQKTWSFYQLSATQVGTVTSVSGSAIGAWVVTLDGRRGVAVDTAAGPPGAITPSWAASLPAPGPDATIVPSASGGFVALVPGVSSIAVWGRTASGSWHRTQVISVASAPAGQSS